MYNQSCTISHVHDMYPRDRLVMGERCEDERFAGQSRSALLPTPTPHSAAPSIAENTTSWHQTAVPPTTVKVHIVIDHVEVSPCCEVSSATTNVGPGGSNACMNP